MGEETVGDRLRRFRRLRKLSQEALAEKSGVRQNYIAQLERGATTVPRDPDNLKLLAAALGVKLRDLAEPTGWYDDEPGGTSLETVLAALYADKRVGDDGKASIERIIRLEVEAAERRERSSEAPTPNRLDRPRRRAV